MKLVIDISKEIYDGIKMGMRNTDDMAEIGDAVENGTPLPKGHGDLKDVQDIINRINLNYNNHQSIDAYSLKDMIATVPTIIKANKDGE